MNLWNVTFELITEESAENGDAAERGFELENGSLRDALEACRAGHWGYTEADCYPLSVKSPPRWLTVYDDGANDFTTSNRTNYSLHIPDHITPASRMRLARLLKCYGV